MKTSDFLVIGGGVIGISVAHELRRRYKDQRVTLIEKEVACGLHASGRNSGVLHAGFYYTSDSLKAKFAREGNARLTRYCEDKKLPILKCGKLVVAQNATEMNRLDELLRRGKANGVKLEVVSEKSAKKIEPRCKTFEKALYSPTTSSVDPVAVMEAMKKDATRAGVYIKEGVQFQKKIKDGIRTNEGNYSAGYVVNCAGLYADKIALAYGFSKDYRILPFKGLYLYLDEPVGSFKTNIYPVPDLEHPFLGVHLTITVDGRSKIGPTAMPAFWREQYSGMRNFDLREFAEILLRESSLFMFSDFGFKKLALSELKKQSRGEMSRLASKLMTGLGDSGKLKWGKTGIRAQLVHMKTRKLEMDFVLEGDAQSFHVLNVVSPGFTCALPFSQYVCDKIVKQLN